MKQLNLIIIIVAVALTASCSDYYMHSKNLDSQIDIWLREHQYTRIENTLKLLEKDHPDYKKITARIPDIKKKKNSYINKIIKTTSTRKNNGQWQSAIDGIELALSKNPGDKKLTAEYELLINERDILINELRKMMLIRKARTLLQYASVYQQLERLIPNDYNAQFEIDEYNREREEIADLLMGCTNHALANRDYFLATECLTLSNQLVSSKEKQQLLKTAVANRKKVDKKTTIQTIIKQLSASQCQP